MSDTYHKCLARIKVVYPRTYARWTERENLCLIMGQADLRPVL
jgi:hypothetical protein